MMEKIFCFWKKISVLPLIWLLCFGFIVEAQQAGTASYVYDQNGRLQAVFYNSGEVVIYEYDPAGNFTSIRRPGANELQILNFIPRSGLSGSRVKLYGVGFNNVSSVSFNGIQASIISSNNNIIVAEVPPNATTGLVSITTPLGTVITTTPFAILGIAVSPPVLTMQESEVQQFTADVRTPSSNEEVIWSVNGIIGGNAVIGTVSNTGLYNSPELNASIDVVIRATGVEFPAIFGESRVRVQSQNDLRLVLSSAISIGRGEPGVFNSALSSPVTIARGEPGIFNSTFSPPVSVVKGLVITGISPSTVTRGTSPTVTISGSNLTGVTVLTFVNPNSSTDSTITVTNITVNGNGTSLTAVVNVGANAATGSRIAIVSNSTTQSPAFRHGSNVIQIQ
jgi:YD repeat-containing protein